MPSMLSIQFHDASLLQKLKSVFPFGHPLSFDPIELRLRQQSAQDVAKSKTRFELIRCNTSKKILGTRKKPAEIHLCLMGPVAEQNSMRIGIIGAGKVGGGLGKLWVRVGHHVFFSSRHPNRPKVLVKEAGSGAYSGNVADAALFGDVILFSPNFWGVDDALEATGPLKGKTVIDVTSPLEWNPNGRMVRSLSGSTTAGEELAKRLPGAHVVKAFSTIPASFIPHAFYRPGHLQRLVVFYCGDHRISKVAVHQLIADSGFVGVDTGPLRLAKELEAPGRLHRAGLVGIVEARRLLKEIADSVQIGTLTSRVSDQPAFAAIARSSFVFLGDQPIGPNMLLPTSS
jgi:8-hydroxy-5-deazaflavin:NADPH oxidoreductase